MQRKWVIFALLLGASACLAQSGNLSDWQKLVGKKECAAAKTLCTPFAASKDVAQQAEAQRCLAESELCGHAMMLVQPDNKGGTVQRDSFTPASVDGALAHVRLGLKAAPQSLDLHRERLHILEVAGRYGELIKALEQSCLTYKGKDVPDAWLIFANDLAGIGRYETGLEFMKVLDRHYPESPDVLGNVGAFELYLDKPAAAIPYLEKAAALDPRDESDAWDLGSAYDATGKTPEADKWYQKGLSLQTDPAQHRTSACTYAQFVELKLKDRTRACKMEVENCPDDKQTACAAPKK